MQRHRHLALFIVGAALWAGVAGAQDYDVRTFVADPSVARSDDDSSTTKSYQYLFNSIRQRYVCPYCSFSRDSAGTCPDPWSVPGHPSNTNLIDFAATPKNRFLALAAQTMDADNSDLRLPNAAGTLLYRALMGRPYKPLDADGNTVRSTLYAAAAGLINNDASLGPVIDAGDPVRWLIIPPTPLRRDPKATDVFPLTSTPNYGLPQRRPEAQVDPGTAAGGDDDWAPQVLDQQSPGMGAIAPEELGDYIGITVNPYRVDDGDYWFVRYKERTVDVGGGNLEVRQASVEIYSVMYGWQGEVDGVGVPVPLTITPPGATPSIEYPYHVIADSGAIRVSILDGTDDQPGWATSSTGAGVWTWVVGFMVRSNCRMIPGWRDLYSATTDPEFPKDADGNVNPGNGGFDFISDPFPGRKRSWMAAGGAAAVPTVTTATDVEQTGNPPLAYVIPANATGDGTAAVQWRGPDPGTEAAWTPDPAGTNAADTIYYRTGYEWQYDAGVNGGAVTEITNDEIAGSGTPNYSAAYPYVHLAGARFMATRPETPRTNTWWDRDGNGSRDELAETQGLPLATPKVILGLRNTAGADELVYGAFGPGSTTPRRTYDMLNRWLAGEATYTCDTCGANYPPRWNGTAWVVNKPDECVYHGVATGGATNIKVANAGTAAYNGIYYPTGTPMNGYMTYQKDATHNLWYRVFAKPNKNRWVLSSAMGGGSIAYSGKQRVTALPANRWTGGVNAPFLSWATASPHVGETSPRGGGNYDAAAGVWRDATAIGVDERTAPTTAARLVLPASAFKSAGRSVAALRDVALPAQNEVWAEIPRYQAASVPGTGLTNDYTNDLGYRGGMVAFRNETAPTTFEAQASTRTPLTTGWDTFYRNPDTGSFQPSVATWPFKCTGASAADSSDDHIVWAAAAACPLHPAATVTEVSGRHYYCPRCGTEWPEAGSCAFDGTALLQMPIALAVRQEHLVAEEYDPFEVQVSVTRNGAALAQSTPTIEIGRVAPGVRATQPDTTSRGTAANNYALTSHRASPADVSPVPLTAQRPTDARATWRNETNIALPLRVGNVHDPVTGNGQASHGDYLRQDVDPFVMSWGRKAQGGPLTLDTLMPRVEAPGGAGTFEGDLLNQAVWDILAPSPDAMAGEDTWLLAGNTNRASAAGLITAGTYTGRPIAKPVPYGQPVGLYVGRHPQYLDVNGNGVFDFRRWDGGAYQATDSSAAEYNPALDDPMEPLVGLLNGQMRVVETRVPQSDYYSADNDPIVLPSPTPGVMQVIWSSNRKSADSSQGSYNASAVAAGSGPADMPSSRTPLNLIYMTTTGYTDSNDPLYRQYVWPVAGSGAIAPAAALTNQPDSTAGRITNSSPWAMYDLAGNKWSFWHRSQPNAGGVESTLRYNGPLASASWNWNLASERFIYDTGQPKQGMRGFWGAGGAWLFWHEGTPGRERLMYRWNFDGTATPNEAPVPVTNQARAGVTDLVSAPTTQIATLPMVIRKTSTSPFTYTRDTSVFTSTPAGGPPTANVFFSGFVTHEGQADICWTKFNINTLPNAGAGVTWAADNYSKLPFPRVSDEEMDPDGMHQLWGSRHLDWLVGRNTASDTPVTRAFLRGDGISPAFRLQLGYHDTIGDGLGRGMQEFDIVWDDSRENTYDRARGVYRVTPILMAVNGSSLPTPWAYHPTSGSYTAGWYLRDPGSPAGTPRPISMEINPAAGTVVFSSPLLNEDAPSDPTAVLTNAAGLALSGAALDEVVLHVSYTPYIYRVTRSGPGDDSPSAFWDPTTGGRLTVFWRRSFAASEAPHFGRPSYMYKCYTTTVQVARPPVQGNATITDWSSGAAVTVLASNPSAGIYTVDPAVGQAYLRVEYNDGTTTRVERHQVISWSQEMVVPVDTVVGEGSMVAVPESFSVPPTEGAAASVPAVRYWLFWSSPRGVYDLRLVEDNGTRVAGDSPVHPSSDIYSAVVAPEFGSLVPERTVPTILTNPT